MIRIEYTIDGKFWNHISQDFTSLVDANRYVEQAEIKKYATQIKYLTIAKEEVIECARSMHKIQKALAKHEGRNENFQL